MTARKPRLNRHGCQPSEDVCLEHTMPLLNRVRCEEGSAKRGPAPVRPKLRKPRDLRQMGVLVADVDWDEDSQQYVVRCWGYDHLFPSVNDVNRLADWLRAAAAWMHQARLDAQKAGR